MDNYYNDTGYTSGTDIVMPLAECIHCKKGIYEPDEAMIINANKCAIHIDCWEDYAAENYEEFLSECYS